MLSLLLTLQERPTGGAYVSAQETCTPTASPSSQRPKPRKGKPSPQSQDAMAESEPPPKRSTRSEMATTYTSGVLPMAPLATAGSSSSGAMGPPPSVPEPKRLQKKLREAQRLVELQLKERELTPDELEKVGKIDTWRQQLALLEQGTPLGTPLATPTRTPGSVASSAQTQLAMNAGKAAAASQAAHEKLDSLPRSPEARKSTRATAAEVAKEQAAARTALACAREEAAAAARTADAELWLLLRAPFDAWDDEVIWQLVMCEHALLHLDDVASSPKQLQLDFRDACEEVRHPQEVPRLRGSLQIDAIDYALDRSELLREELQRQLERYKRLYCSMLSGFGRFRKVAPQPGETLLALMGRTHGEALAWRPPGKSPAEKLALVSKEGVRYAPNATPSSPRAPPHGTPPQPHPTTQVPGGLAGRHAHRAVL